MLAAWVRRCEVIVTLICALLLPANPAPPSLVCHNSSEVFYSVSGASSVAVTSPSDARSSGANAPIGMGARLVGMVSPQKNLLTCLVQTKSDDQFRLVRLKFVNKKWQSTATTIALSIRSPGLRYNRTYQLLRLGDTLLLRIRGQETISPESTLVSTWILAANGSTAKRVREAPEVAGRFAQIGSKVLAVASRYLKGQSRMAEPRFTFLAEITMDRARAALSCHPVRRLSYESLERLRPYTLLDSNQSFHLLSLAGPGKATIYSLDGKGHPRKQTTWRLPPGHYEAVYSDALPFALVGRKLFLADGFQLKPQAPHP